MSNEYLAEYYFDYKIQSTLPNSSIKDPKLFFERNYRLKGLPYSMFAVLDGWNGKQEIYKKLNGKLSAKEKQEELDHLDFDTVQIVYDDQGMNPAVLDDEKGEFYQKAEKKETTKFVDYCKNGYTLTIYSGKDTHSGAGIIKMFKNKELVGKFYFVNNFVQRKYIDYTLKLGAKRMLSLKFYCKSCPQDIEVGVIGNESHYPCLASESNNFIKTFKLDFNNKGEFAIDINVNEDKFKAYNHFSVVFPDQYDNLKRFYLLNPVDNNTIFSSKPAKTQYQDFGKTCPYCHKLLSESAMDAKKSKGGIPCSGKITKGGPTIYKDSAKKHKHNCVYCVGDLKGENDNTFNNDFERLLPANYQKDIKIALAGSSRSGKTTYISRFFGLTKSESGNVLVSDMLMTKNALSEYNINIDCVKIPNITIKGPGEYVLNDTNWIIGNKEYVNRAISIYHNCYPEQTTTSGELFKYPFISLVNNKHYVSMYDVAGEDSQTKNIINSICKADNNNEIIGIFIIVNGNLDKLNASAVFRNISEAKLNPNCPVAVILSKMDTLEGMFDSNALCIRSRYKLRGRTYENSELQKMIDISSEEIRTYLLESQISEQLKEFKNVKYFCTSSYTFLESIHDSELEINDPGEPKFECSIKRLELPFVWMLNQFGVLK